MAWGISWFLGGMMHGDPMRDGCHGSPTHTARTVAWQRPTKSGHWAGARGGTDARSASKRQTE